MSWFYVNISFLFNVEFDFFFIHSIKNVIVDGFGRKLWFVFFNYITMIYFFSFLLLLHYGISYLHTQISVLWVVCPGSSVRQIWRCFLHRWLRHVPRQTPDPLLYHGGILDLLSRLMITWITVWCHHWLVDLTKIIKVHLWWMMVTAQATWHVN